MKTTVESLKDNQAKVLVTIDAADVDARIKKAYREFAQKYNFPGFRRGRAPRPVIDNALGADYVRAHVTEDLVDETYPLAVDEANLYTIGQPKMPDDMDIVHNGEDYSYTFEVDVKPELELSNYDPVSIEMPPEGASEEEIDEQLEGLREHYFTLEDAAANAKINEGGFADIKIAATDDKGETIDALTADSREYGLGLGLFPKSFDDELVGLKKGDKKTFSIDVPAQPTALTASLMGKTSKINFDLEILRVKKKVLPEITDEWTKDTIGFDTVEKLRTQIAESITEEKDRQFPGIKETRCLNELADRLQGDVPESMCEDAERNLLTDFFNQLQSQGASFDMYLAQQGISADQFSEDVKKQALDMTKQDLALDAWAKHTGIEVSDEDVHKEFVDSGVENPEKLEDEWRGEGRLHLVRQGIKRARAAKEVMDSAKVSIEKPKAKKKASTKSSSKSTKSASTKKAGDKKEKKED
ncbi:MAG: trigger factor [Eggerthellaceae bacterium]